MCVILTEARAFFNTFLQFLNLQLLVNHFIFLLFPNTNTYSFYSSDHYITFINIQRLLVTFTSGKHEYNKQRPRTHISTMRTFSNEERKTHIEKLDKLWGGGSLLTSNSLRSITNTHTKKKHSNDSKHKHKTTNIKTQTNPHTEATIHRHKHIFNRIHKVREPSDTYEYT